VITMKLDETVVLTPNERGAIAPVPEISADS
jgi:hypothetical protein